MGRGRCRVHQNAQCWTGSEADVQDGHRGHSEKGREVRWYEPMVGWLTECLEVSWFLAYQLGLKLILCGLFGGKWYGGSFDMSRPDMREYGLE